LPTSSFLALPVAAERRHASLAQLAGDTKTTSLFMSAIMLAFQRTGKIGKLPPKKLAGRALADEPHSEQALNNSVATVASLRGRPNVISG
jgi:hypothetical protein